MRKLFWTALLLLPLGVAGGLAYGKAQADRPQPANTDGYVCPITGEDLPCPLCCPLNVRK